MSYKIIVENFGKIEKAEIEVAPLTLFVGDNNSGKSYLLSLVWALQNLNHNHILFNNYFEFQAYPEYEKIKNTLLSFINHDSFEQNFISISSEDFVTLFNIVLEKRRNQFVSDLFNYAPLSIKKLAIVNDNKIRLTLTIDRLQNAPQFTLKRENTEIAKLLFGNFSTDTLSLNSIIEWITFYIICERTHIKTYLPSARTGFILSKEVINKFARKNTFNTDKQEVEPFTKPILNFLDNLDSLYPEDSNENIVDIVIWAESTLTHGAISISSLPNKEIRYTPEGLTESIPMRTSSAVITELASLMLFLKHRKSLDSLCYEEPEMSLHPQLQLEMGKLLVRLVNKGIHIAATTHSDIIMQHVNNMCKLHSLKNNKNILKENDLTEDDMLDIKNVAVYQLTDKGGHSVVERIEPTEDGFKVPTFRNALKKIFEETIDIQSN